MSRLSRPALAVLTAVLAALASPALADPNRAADRADPVGARRLMLPSREPGRLLETVVVYPAAAGGTPALLGDNRLVVGTPVRRDAPVAPGRHPVVLLSHGSGGNVAGLAWLSTRLAAAGYVVIGPNHPGTTSGDSTATATVAFWRRPPDLLAALDGVLADPALGPAVAADAVAVVGFSLGGTDALLLAGARLDRRAFAAGCDRIPDLTVCVWLKRGGVDVAALDPRVEADLREPRVKAVVAVDPGFAPSFTAASLAAVAIPVALVNLGTPATTPVILEARPLADAILGARLDRVDDAVHYSFLAVCKPGAAALLAADGEDAFCDDAPGARPRAVLHDAIAAPILDAIRHFLPVKSAP
jgi:predicted dienelactone hydrolase